MTDSSRVIELKSAIANEVKAMDEAMAGVKVEGNNVTVSPEIDAEIKKRFKNATEIKALLSAEEFAAETKSWLDAPTSESIALGATQTKTRLTSLGQAFVQSEEFKAMKNSGGYTMPKPFEVNGVDLTAGYGQKDVYAGQVADAMTRNLNTIQFDPIVPRGYRPTRVRDLFPAASTSSSLIDFFRVMGFVTDDVAGAGLAAGVADRNGGNTDFGTKPKSALRFENAQAAVRTIAHWEAAHRNTLDDMPQLQSIIDNELMYGLRLVEDHQILFGAGGDELDGLMLTAGVQTYTALVDEINSDVLRKSATKGILANYAPTGYVLHPNDWEKTELQRGLDGQYMLVLNVAVGAETRVWRLPVVETPAMTEGTFLTGAFGLGAQLYDRQQANIRVAEQHADFFVKNAIAVLAEERLAFAVKRPESFVIGTFNA